MAVRKGYTSVMVIIAVFASIGIIGYMLQVPGMIEDEATRHLAGQSSYTAATSMGAFIDDDYLDRSINYTISGAAYRFARRDLEVKRWTGAEVATMGDMVDAFNRTASNYFEQEYIASQEQVQEGCTVGGGGFSTTIHEQMNATADAYGFNYTAGPLPYIQVRCGTMDRGDAGQTTTIQVPGRLRDFAAGNRLFYMMNTSRTLALSQGFRSIIANSTRRSSNITVVYNEEEEVGNCVEPDCAETTGGAEADYPGWGGHVSSLENEQESNVNPQLESALQTWIDDTFQPGHTAQEGFGGLDISVDTYLEYSVNERRRISADEDGSGYIVSSCEGSCDVHLEQGRSACINADTGVEVSCTDISFEQDQCPAVPNDNGEYCSTSSWDTIDSRPDAPPLWTDDPWELTAGETHQDPFQQVAAGQAVVSAFTRPFRDPVRNSHGSEPASCEFSWGSCPSANRTSCCETLDRVNHNEVHQTTRRIWEIQELASTVRVEVTITDTRNELPVESGWEHPEFTFIYTQQSTHDFQGNPEYEDAGLRCSDAEYLGEDC